MILDLYSKRQRAAKRSDADVFQYDDIPASLRVQIVHIWNDTLGDIEEGYGGNQAANTAKWIHDALCREYGLFRLSTSGNSHFDFVSNYFLQCADTNRVIDIIELFFRLIDRVVRNELHQYYRTSLSPDDAIADLNARFLEHGVGFEYQSGELIRVDSKLLHKEAIKPTLQLLAQKRFQGANDEFLKAFEHYRHGRFKEALNECLKAFESTLKIICKERKWKVEQNATAKALIETSLKNNLLPEFLQSQFAALRSLLESGVPTGRNKLSGHGQGPETLNVPRYFASYILHLTATTILLFVEADKEMH